MIDSEGAAVLLAEAKRIEVLSQSTLVEQLAVVGTFEPRTLNDPDAQDIVNLLCDRLPSREVMLRDSTRVEALAKVLARGGTGELRQLRRRVEVSRQGSALQRMLDAFVIGDGPPVRLRDEDELLASLSVWRWATEAVARAGQSNEVSIEPDKDAIESRLALLDVTRAIRRLARAGCVGRDNALQRLHDYVELKRLPSSDLQSEPAMVVYGIGGIGKSTLIAQFVMDLYRGLDAPGNGAWAYLDLDRPTLASGDPAVVLTDIIRQVAAQLPEERRHLIRVEEVNRRRKRGAGLEASDSAGSYRQSASQFINDISAALRGPFIVVIDTYEQLERNRIPSGELHSLFAQLAARLPNFRLIVAGRTPAAAFVDPGRPDRQLHVVGLDDEAALGLLRHFISYEAHETGRPAGDIDDDLGRDIIAVVGGVPLTVRLAARVLLAEGPDVFTGVADRARALDRVREEFVRGFLYQRILNHVTARPPVSAADLRRLARASIALRRITVDIIDEVLMPSLIPPPSATPVELFNELKSEVAFIDSEIDTLRLREELRLPALTAVQIDDPALVRRVHTRAVEYYARSVDSTAALEHAYHRLALGASPTQYDESMLRDLEPAADDLPPATAARVREAAADRAGLIVAQDLESWERSVLPKADAALRDGRINDARRLLAHRAERSMASELHRLQSRLAQAEGDVAAATAAARLDLEAAGFAADPTRFAAAAVRLAALHELAGEGARTDETFRIADESALLVGFPDLRLELLLNRMNARERSSVEDRRSSWRHGLQVRALMQRMDQRELSTNTALIRLLAAALGRDEPDRIRAALLPVGLGHDEDPLRVQALVTALADWDASGSKPGSLARRYLRLDGEGYEAIFRAWTALRGLGTDAGTVLEQLWRFETPPDAVREALRAIYLWWGVDRGPTPSEDFSTAVPRFLTDQPLDWSRSETLAIEDLLLTAYPTPSERMALSSRAGLDLTLISWNASERRGTREILGTASRSGRLEALIVAMLTDPAARSINESLRRLLGDDWLAQHNL
jgi:hypothetical protein